MALSRARKEELVEQYQDGLAKAPHVFLLDFSGISVPQATELRNRLRETGGSYVVVKNRLALRSIEGCGLADLSQLFTGPTAAAYTEESPVNLAKALTDFAKEVPALDFKGGLVDGQTVGAEEIQQIASLPTREELIAKLLYLLQSPAARLTRTLAEIQRRFVVVLGQVAAGKQDDAGG